MSNGGGIIGGIISILIGAVLVFFGASILNISPESNATEGSLTEMIENTPRSLGWIIGVMGVVFIIIGFLVIIATVKS